jgi:hypothetical protein
MYSSIQVWQGSSFVLDIQAGRPSDSPCLSHYAGHLATMPSADFFLITTPVTQHSAIDLHLFGRYTPKSQGTY